MKKRTLGQSGIEITEIGLGTNYVGGHNLYENVDEEEGIRIVQRAIPSMEKRGMVGKIELEIQVPPEFPQKYYSALVRSAEQCAVKQHMENPPQFEIFTKEVEMA